MYFCQPNTFPSLRESTSSSTSSSPAANRHNQPSPIHSHLLGKGHARKFSLGSDDGSVIATRYTTLTDTTDSTG